MGVDDKRREGRGVLWAGVRMQGGSVELDAGEINIGLGDVGVLKSALISRCMEFCWDGRGDTYGALYRHADSR